VSVKVKGSAVQSGRRFLTERFGPSAWAEVLAGLSPDERSVLEEEGARATGRCPQRVYLKALRRAHQLYSPEEPRLHEVMGRALVDHATAYKPFFRIGTPKFLISQIPEVWNVHFNSGEMRAVVTEKRRAVVELRDFEEPAAELCEWIVGWFVRTLELTRAREIHMAHTECVSRGGRVCRFEGHWA
jgi:hypothetical protein